jgi:hypothetical protein
MASNTAQVQEPGAGKWLFMMLAQNHVFGDGKIPDHAIAHAFFGDVGEHAVGEIARLKAGHIFAFEDYASLCNLAQASDRFRQLALAIARNTGDAKDLARA